MTASDPRVGEIQAEAIAAAAKAFIEYGTILPAIKAAAPYIAAKALEDAATVIAAATMPLLDLGTCRYVAEHLSGLAKDLRGEA